MTLSNLVCILQGHCHDGFATDEVEILDDNNKIIGYLNSVIVTRDHDREVIGLKLISQGENNETISALGRRENTTIRRN